LKAAQTARKEAEREQAMANETEDERTRRLRLERKAAKTRKARAAAAAAADETARHNADLAAGLAPAAEEAPSRELLHDLCLTDAGCGEVLATMRSAAVLAAMSKAQLIEAGVNSSDATRLIANGFLLLDTVPVNPSIYRLLGCSPDAQMRLHKLRLPAFRLSRMLADDFAALDAHLTADDIDRVTSPMQRSLIVNTIPAAVCVLAKCGVSDRSQEHIVRLGFSVHQLASMVGRGFVFHSQVTSCCSLTRSRNS
jgi:hypothetical protein